MNDLSVTPLQATHVPDCEAISRALPEWFGVEEGLAEMRGYLETGPGLVALAGGEVVGFLTLHRHFAETWEITWMAVARDWHRRSAGRGLIEAAAAQCRRDGARWLLVKTLADSHPSEEYRATRAFYQARGFDRLSVYPDLWGPDNPCLLMVRRL
jgi:GNAT superfamily N-acetyltransferase